jgi:hypothetical protein
MNRAVSLSCLIVAGLASASTADLLTSNTLEAPAVIDFSQFPEPTFVDAGVQIGDLVGEDVFVTALGDHRVGPMNHGLGLNGTWTRSGMLNNAHLDGFATITFNDGPVSGVGGFVNYAPDFGDYTIAALDSDGKVLESYNIVQDAPISTPGGLDAGVFRGIQRAKNDIYAFRLSFAFNVIDDLAFSRGGGCFADCDGNGALNILDFVCYQGLFQSGDPAADCDGNGQLNILDFVCFQGAFVKGCN